MKSTANIVTLNVEVFTDTLNGPANYNGYLDLSNMISGDNLEIIHYIDVAGDDANVAQVTETINFTDLATVGLVHEIEPFSIEGLQTSRVGLKLTAGTVPLDIPWRQTNLKTGT